MENHIFSSWQSPVMSNWQSLKLKWLKMTARAVKLFFYLKVSGISFQMGDINNVKSCLKDSFYLTTISMPKVSSFYSKTRLSSVVSSQCGFLLVQMDRVNTSGQPLPMSTVLYVLCDCAP